MNFNFYLNSYKKKDGTQTIRLQLNTSSKDIQYLDSDISVLVSQWDKNKRKVKRHPLEDQLNAKLNTLKITVHKLYLNNDGISAKKLHCLYKNLQKYDSSSLIDFYQNIVDKKTMKKKIRTAITAQRYIEKLKRYNSTICFSDLSVQWALDYETWMLKLGNKTNTRAATFKSLNAVLNKAVKVGVISKNPIKGFDIVTENVEKESLTLKEIDKIRNLQLPSRYKNMIKARDMFLFSFYTAGMRFTDMCRLKWDNIIGDSIVYTMQKSKDRAGSRRTIPLNIRSKEILNIYKGKNKNFVFPPLYGYHKSKIEDTEYRIFRQNTYLNKPLKIIAKKCGINKSLSMHIAKHSFSDYAVKSKVDLLVLSKLLGHVKLSTTQHYLKDFYQKEESETINRLFK